MKEQNLDRAAVVLLGTGHAPPVAETVVRAVEAAIHRLDPAAVTFDGTTISIRTERGECLFAIPSGSCLDGVPVRSPVRAAFQMAEPESGLQKRGEVRDLYPAQAITFGKEAAIVALGGDAQYSPPDRVLLVRFANDSVAPPAGDRLTAAIRRVLSRVGR